MEPKALRTPAKARVGHRTLSRGAVNAKLKIHEGKHVSTVPQIIKIDRTTMDVHFE